MMKNFQNQIVVALLFLSVSYISCKKSDLITYSSDRNLFFEIQDSKDLNDPAFDHTLNVDSVRMFFSLMGDDVTAAELKIPIKLAGKPLEQPLEYSLVIDQANTTALEGADFEWAKQHIFPAGKNIDTLRIKINRTQKMLTRTLKLSLQLQTNANFKAIVEPGVLKTRSTKIKCYLNDILSPPDGYISTSIFQGADFYYGTFSRKKLNVLSTVVETEFGEPFPPDVLYPLMVAYADFLAPILDEYLREQKRLGKPIYEADGSEMTTGKFFE